MANTGDSKQMSKFFDNTVFVEQREQYDSINFDRYHQRCKQNDCSFHVLIRFRCSFLVRLSFHNDRTNESGKSHKPNFNENRVIPRVKRIRDFNMIPLRLAVDLQRNPLRNSIIPIPTRTPLECKSILFPHTLCVTYTFSVGACSG